VTLTTIGFGDYVPLLGAQRSPELVRLYAFFSSVWLWVGLALVSAIIGEFQGLINTLGERFHTRTIDCCCYVKERVEVKKHRMPNVVAAN